MPGISGAPHHGYDRHVRLCQEATFGECPAEPAWRAVPILGDGWKLKSTSPRYFPDTNLAGYRRTGIAHQLLVRGTFTTLAWFEHLDFLLDMALERDVNGDVYSYCADYYTPPDPRRYLGIVTETLTLRVHGTGNADVQVELGLRAKLEQKNAALDPDMDFDYAGLTCVPFMFRDAHIAVNAVELMDVSRFTITVHNAVAQGPIATTAGAALGTVAYLAAGRRVITLAFEDVNKDDRLNQAIRVGGELSFEACFYHPLGHLFQLQLPALAAEYNDESTGADEPTKEAALLHAIVPCAGGDDIIYGVDPGPTTTTLAPLTTTPGA